MEKPALLLVEASPAEATLARAALALHAAGSRVLEARNMAAAARLLRRSGEAATLVVVGARAFAGRPRTWPAYRAFVERRLAGWLPTRKALRPRPGRTS